MEYAADEGKTPVAPTLPESEVLDFFSPTPLIKATVVDGDLGIGNYVGKDPEEGKPLDILDPDMVKVAEAMGIVARLIGRKWVGVSTHKEMPEHMVRQRFKPLKAWRVVSADDHQIYFATGEDEDGVPVRQAIEELADYYEKKSS